MSTERRAAAGFTLVEMIVAIVVMGVALVGLLSAVQVATRGAGDVAVRRQLVALAEELMEEVQLKPWAAAANDPPAACARDTYNDLADFDGYVTTGQVCRVDGSPVAALAGIDVRISVTAATLAGLPARRIDVSVSQGSERLVLTGWRTDYAGP